MKFHPIQAMVRQVFMAAVAAVSLVSMALLTGCSKPVVPPDQMVFSENPTEDIRRNIESFKLLPKQDADILLAYIVANDVQRMKGAAHAELNGKRVDQVMLEAKQWSVAMQQFMQQNQLITQQILQAVEVEPVEKLLADAPTAIGTKAQLMTIRYRVNNKGTHVIAGVRGRMHFWFASNNAPIGALDVAFTGPFGLGTSGTVEGGAPVLVGSTSAEMFKEFTRAQISELRYEFRPTMLVYQDGRVVQTSTF